MKKKKNLTAAIALLAAFGLWTAALRLVDVQIIGPLGSAVGFATVNGFFHKLTGVHMGLYAVTDWLGLVPVCFAAGFGILGLIQWIRRKRLWRVDRSILILGIFYTAVMAAYIFFEAAVINYRPVLIDGVLEASYPSSTTLLAMCIMPTAAMELRNRIKNPVFKNCVLCSIYAFTVFMVAGRLISGVHWVTDIVGGGLLSGGLVELYRVFRQKT